MKIIYPFVFFLSTAAVFADEHVVAETFPDNCDVTGSVNIPNVKAMRALKCIGNNDLS